QPGFGLESAAAGALVAPFDRLGPESAVHPSSDAQDGAGRQRGDRYEEDGHPPVARRAARVLRDRLAERGAERWEARQSQRGDGENDAHGLLLPAGTVE